MNPDEHIKSLLLDGPKSFTELAKVISTKYNPKGDCAHGTLVAHLKSLVKDKVIERNREEGSVTYSLMPQYISSAGSARDTITLQSLMSELEHKTRKDLNLEKADRARVRGFDLVDRIALPNKPKAGFLLRLDKDTARIADLVQPTSDLSSKLEELIEDKLNLLKKTMPTTIQNELDFLTENPKDWSEIMDFSRKAAKKHGFRFLVASWYDGKDYGERIRSAMKNLEKLQRKHEDDCSFLDEINKRCFYSNLEYYWEDPIEMYPFETISTISHSSLLEDGFSLHYYEDQDLMRLEVALISGNPTEKLRKDLFKEELEVTALERVHSPYSILSTNAYVRMKLPFLDEREKKLLVADLLRLMQSEWAKMLSVDYQLNPEDYRLAVDLLAKKLNIDLDRAQESISSPIMNFKFYDGPTLVDFSDEPLVKNFFEFRNNPEKRKWLQKCLLQGLPIFMHIPFDKLGFEVRSIL